VQLEGYKARGLEKRLFQGWRAFAARALATRAEGLARALEHAKLRAVRYAGADVIIQVKSASSVVLWPRGRVNQCPGQHTLPGGGGMAWLTGRPASGRSWQRRAARLKAVRGAAGEELARRWTTMLVKTTFRAWSRGIRVARSVYSTEGTPWWEGVGDTLPGPIGSGYEDKPCMDLGAFSSFCHE
jgi:hypothetical protein